jgi:hypothetical protein
MHNENPLTVNRNRRPLQRLPGVARSQQLSVRLLSNWQACGALFIVCASLLSVGSYRMLVSQQTNLSCQNVFWPFASASLRLYCAQKLAEKNTLEDLFAAIGLVDVLDKNHPLRAAINPQIELWSNRALDLAEKAFHEGKLERAISFAKRIPARTAAAKVVQERIKRWQTVWTEGEGIYQKAEDALNQEDWRKAFSIMVGLLKVDNRYWSGAQYNALNKRILLAQEDEKILAKAKNLIKRGGLKNLAEALGLAQDLKSDSVFRRSADAAIETASQKLMQLAENALERQDLTLALDAAQLIPKETRVGQRAEDFIDLAYASASAWSGTAAGFQDAISAARKISPNSSVYEQAQTLALQWEGQLASLRQRQIAEANAEEYNASIVESIADPIDWQEPPPPPALSEVSKQGTADQVMLDRADSLSLSGDRKSLTEAIRLAKQIAPGRIFYEDAQARIADWQFQLQQLNAPQPAEALPESLDVPDSEAKSLWQQAQKYASQGSPSSLAAAIDAADQIAPDSPLRVQAEESINAWSQRILTLAQTTSNSNLSQAIEIAQQIPPNSPVYDAAQSQIRQWQERS